MKEAMHSALARTTSCVLVAVALAACSKTEEKPAPPAYSAKFIASQKYLKNDGPFKTVSTACEREIVVSNACAGKAAQWFGPAATDTRNTPERFACLQEMMVLPNCKVLAESGQVLMTLTAQRAVSEEAGRKMYGKNFVELER